MRLESILKFTNLKNFFENEFEPTAINFMNIIRIGVFFSRLIINDNYSSLDYTF